MHSEFESALAASGAFRLGAPEQSQATCHLKVTHLGMRRHSFSADMKPIVNIKLTLVDRAGKVLWTDKEETGEMSEETPAYPYPLYLEQPEKIREVYTAAIRLSVADLVQNLRERMSR